MKKYLLYIIFLLIFFSVGIIGYQDFVGLVFGVTLLLATPMIFMVISDLQVKRDFNLIINSKNGKVCINTNSGLVKYQSDIFNINEITKYQLVKEDLILLSSGIGEAIAGGVLFGGSGAIAGSLVGKKEKHVKKCVLYIETNNIVHAGVTITVTEEAGFKICRVFELYKNK